MITLYQGDCLDILPTLESKVDAVTTDPPYGIEINKSQRLSKSRGFGNDTWDKERLPLHIKMIISLNLPTIIWGGNYYADILPPSRGWLAWDKVNDGRDFGEFELAWTTLDEVPRRFKFRPVNMDGGKVHPTQKPISLMMWCIEKVSNFGDTILDPFMGSGTTAIACIKTGRNFIGIEKEEKYFDIAANRIKAENSQLSMFVPHHEITIIK